jgi:hypothetical protein
LTAAQAVPTATPTLQTFLGLLMRDILSLSLLLFLGLGRAAAFDAVIVTEVVEVDIVVYGATSAGVSAAVQAARMGKSVVLIEPGKHVGGLTTSGLGFTDSGNKEVVGGIAREFYQRVKKHYDDPSAWKSQKAESYKL